MQQHKAEVDTRQVYQHLTEQVHLVCREGLGVLYKPQVGRAFRVGRQRRNRG